MIHLLSWLFFVIVMSLCLVIPVASIGLIVFGLYKGLQFLSMQDENKSKNVKEGITFNGHAQLRNQTFTRVKINGFAQLHSIKITDSLIVNGNISANKLQVHNLCANGAVELEEAIVTGTTKINGALHGIRSQFCDIIMCSNKIELHDSSAKEIIVQKIPGLSWGTIQQQLILKNTVISGDITFQSGKGEVILEGNARIDGKVVGGTIG